MTDPTNDKSGEIAPESGAHVADDASTNGSPGREVADLQADIERTREDLAHTVDQLTAKLDVKSRAKGCAAEIKQQASLRVQAVRGQAPDEQGKPTPVTMSAVGGVAVGVVGLIALTVWRRRRAHQSPKTLSALRRGPRSRR